MSNTGKPKVVQDVISINNDVDGLVNIVIPDIYEQIGGLSNGGVGGGGSHVHANKNILDSITVSKIVEWDDKEVKGHTHNEIREFDSSLKVLDTKVDDNKLEVLSSLDKKVEYEIDNTSNVNIPMVDEKLDMVNTKYNHISNELIPEIRASLDDIEEQLGSISSTGGTHAHNNKGELDKITTGDVSKWNQHIENHPSGGGNITIGNSLDNYTGSTLNEKMVAMFTDINTNFRETPMVIVLPSGNIEITTNLTAKQWKNKVFRCDGNLIFKNCNGIVFEKMQYSDIFINRVSSVAISSSNTAGLIGLNEVNALTYNGVKLSDCSYNVVKINTIVGFNVGFHLYSEIFSIYSGSNIISGFDGMYDCGGTFYNDIYINAIWRCKQGMLLSAGKHALSSGGAGWVNDNRLFNTFFDCNRALQIGLAYGSRPTGEPADCYQNNKFYNFGFEKIRDTVDPVAIDMIQGQSNSFINPRFEASMTNTGYTIVREGKNATMNRYDTSNYWVNLNRVSLNTSIVKDDGTNQGKQHSVMVASFIKDGTGILANKMTAIKNKVIYEGYGIDNYYFANTNTAYSSPNNMINYTFSDTEFAKYRASDGTIKTMGYTS